MRWVLSVYFTHEETEAQNLTPWKSHRWSEADLGANPDTLTPEPLHRSMALPEGGVQARVLLSAPHSMRTWEPQHESICRPYPWELSLQFVHRGSGTWV